jgi:hypothetical protein
MEQAQEDGILQSLEFTIATHYDGDHVGGMDEILTSDWHPAQAVLDRGDGNLPPFSSAKFNSSHHTCRFALSESDMEDLVPWGDPTGSCPLDRAASCKLMRYFETAEAGGRRRAAVPGEALVLDHDLTFEIVVANATTSAGDTVDVHFAGRRQDCAANDLSVGVLVTFGDFRYFVAGDLTGDLDEYVAKVEDAIAPSLVSDVDVYHVSHHGARTSSILSFVAALDPTITIVSNGTVHGHPRIDVINNRILAAAPDTALYLLNPTSGAWCGRRRRRAGPRPLRLQCRRKASLICAISTLALGCWQSVSFKYVRDLLPEVVYELGPPPTCDSASWSIRAPMPEDTFVFVTDFYRSWASETVLDESIEEAFLRHGIRKAAEGEEGDLDVRIDLLSVPGEQVDGWDVAMFAAAVPVYSLWGFIHILTLGVIPVWYPEPGSHEVVVQVRIDSWRRATYREPVRLAGVWGTRLLPTYWLLLGLHTPEAGMERFFQDVVDDAVRRMQGKGLLAECGDGDIGVTKNSCLGPDELSKARDLLRWYEWSTVKELAEKAADEPERGITPQCVMYVGEEMGRD